LLRAFLFAVVAADAVAIGTKPFFTAFIPSLLEKI
jgi:hypothetical protein